MLIFLSFILLICWSFYLSPYLYVHFTYFLIFINTQLLIYFTFCVSYSFTRLRDWQCLSSYTAKNLHPFFWWLLQNHYIKNKKNYGFWCFCSSFCCIFHDGLTTYSGFGFDFYVAIAPFSTLYLDDRICFQLLLLLHLLQLDISMPRYLYFKSHRQIISSTFNLHLTVFFWCFHAFCLRGRYNLAEGFGCAVQLL